MENKFNKNNYSLNKISFLKFIYDKRILSGPMIENRDPIFYLLKSYDEILELFLNNSKHEMPKFLYFNKNKINKILYEANNCIEIKSNREIENLGYNFYLSLLISDNSNVINYIYSIDLIKNMNRLNRDRNKNSIKKIIYSKIILELIENYKGFQDEVEKYLGEIENDNNKIINDNIKNLDYLNYNFKKKIDEIYLEIVNYLLLSDKKNEYKNIYNKIKELDLENIIITNNMYKELYKFLNNNEKIKDKIILNIDDLYSNNKINFYYILLKYILKSNFYIYQIY